MDTDLKVLLINFTNKEARAIEKNTGIRQIRGYLSERIATGLNAADSSYEFYSPEAFYECEMVMIKMPCSDEIAEEFEEKSKLLTPLDGEKFRRFWRSKGKLIYIETGKSSAAALDHLGIPLVLSTASGNDTRSTETIREDSAYYSLVEYLNGQTEMPPQEYIKSGYPEGDRDYFYANNIKWFALARNMNGDILISGLSKNNGDYGPENLGVLMSPRQKNTVSSTSKVINFFADYMSLRSSQNDWKTSFSMYPQKQLVKYVEEIEQITKEKEKRIEEIRGLASSYRQQYSFLKDLVTEQGDKLVDAVEKTLVEVFGIPATNSDKENDGEPVEDLMVTIGERTIAVEVKGTSKLNPPLQYTQQPFQHIARRGFGPEVEAALIVNHDMKNDPSKRPLPYSEPEKAALLKNLYYIDTRVLLQISKLIIDNELPVEQGVEILFGSKGRAKMPIKKSTS